MRTVEKEPHFAGTVAEVRDNAILVRVNEGEAVRRSSALILVSLDVKLKDSATQFTAGDKIIVYYNGEIAESYPAQIHTVYAIVLTRPGAVADDGTQAMTLEEVRILAQKGEALRFEDFRPYPGTDVSSNRDRHLMLYGVEGGYRLIVDSARSGRPDRVELESVWETDGSGLDIRYGDIDAFLREHPIVMQVKTGAVTPFGLTVTLKNLTAAEYIYGERYAIQRKNEDGWTDVTPVEEPFFHAVGYALPAFESKESTVDWEWRYGKLPAGDYRIVKDASLVRAPGDYDTFILYAAFTVEGWEAYAPAFVQP
ncbi:MAG: YobA family protein [Oscillospiraceae bacterium]|nr:YobA family protein [Oscillospiraceae bacterium]